MSKTISNFKDANGNEVVIVVGNVFAVRSYSPQEADVTTIISTGGAEIHLAAPIAQVKQYVEEGLE